MINCFRIISLVISFYSTILTMFNPTFRTSLPAGLYDTLPQSFSIMVLALPVLQVVVCRLASCDANGHVLTTTINNLLIIVIIIDDDHRFHVDGCLFCRFWVSFG
uniref:Putative secreted peptide n=1 Tax=Anopheles braziliensis TaxID=58242 RepID=A0A2M3ZUI1_9DIPT